MDPLVFAPETIRDLQAQVGASLNDRQRTGVLGEMAARLLRSGAWTAFRTSPATAFRPYGFPWLRQG
ncbi:hypothetical protein JMJ56_22235 [Belnapia sp. T18]|uniref:Uncharacterized protein n=1 Tax=Belnapia arida TaxID=2804533 RepID=A0ABS1U9Z2_9PROT|nr:hypothetical protein [Belnapia arida]MBL6080739.1 hypothetical protein [Belnapia arida]